MSIFCPHCSTQYDSNPALAGRQVCCRQCRKVFTMPPLEVIEVPPAKEAPESNPLDFLESASHTRDEADDGDVLESIALNARKRTAVAQSVRDRKKALPFTLYFLGIAAASLAGLVAVVYLVNESAGKLQSFRPWTPKTEAVARFCDEAESACKLYSLGSTSVEFSAKVMKLKDLCSRIPDDCPEAPKCKIVFDELEVVEEELPQIIGWQELYLSVAREQTSNLNEIVGTPAKTEEERKHLEQEKEKCKQERTKHEKRADLHIRKASEIIKTLK